jgi:ubiquinone/menaquinone biosynthesis C-methylase UbiE
MDASFLFTVFEGLPRQGPGLDAFTAKVFNLLPIVPCDILDVGCGSGMQSLTLARLSSRPMITAVDIYQPYLDELEERAKKEGFDFRIKIVCASMDDLPFVPESFDLIWSEGSANIMGFKEALLAWKKFLKPRGYMAVSECVWFTSKPSEEVKQFFDTVYPAMQTEDKVRKVIEAAGYEVLNTLRLPDAAWWERYYIPLSKKMKDLRMLYPDDPAVQKLLDRFDVEIDMFRNYSHEYGYTFFTMRKKN